MSGLGGGKPHYAIVRNKMRIVDYRLREAGLARSLRTEVTRRIPPLEKAE